MEKDRGIKILIIDEVETVGYTAVTSSGVKGIYFDGVFTDLKGNKICEWCGSKNITDPVKDTLNGICHKCGSSW